MSADSLSPPVTDVGSKLNVASQDPRNSTMTWIVPLLRITTVRT
jgi:hypothetical protein